MVRDTPASFRPSLKFRASCFCVVVAAQFAFTAGSVTWAAEAPPANLMTVVLAPAAPDPRGRIPFVDILMSLPSIHVPAGHALLRLPLTIANLDTSAKALSNIRASDRDGPLLLTAHDDANDREASYRRWSASRDVAGAVTLNYRVALPDRPSPHGPAPPFEVTTDSGGFSGVSGAFLMLPDTDTPIRLAVRWKFPASAVQAIGVSDLGVGDRTDARTRSRDELENTYFMGGNLHHFPERPTENGLFVVWQGTPNYDAVVLARWIEQLYDGYKAFFHADPAMPCNVFLRASPLSGGGIKLGQSFVVTFDARTKPDDLKITLAHEMIHRFVGWLDHPPQYLSAWFGEGIADYYERALPWRLRLIGPDTFLADLNKTATRYYTNSQNRLANEALPARAFIDARVQALPYDRGSLYFAAVNEAIAAHSHGTRSLDDIILSMLAHHRRGDAMDQATWVRLLVQELGPSGRTQFEAMMSGQLVIPPADSYGPCFERSARRLPEYDLGFPPDVLSHARRFVESLELNSSGERAGLRNGDEIVGPVLQAAIESDVHALIHFQVTRKGKVATIDYLPRGRLLPAYTWTRTAGVPDAACVATGKSAGRVRRVRAPPRYLSRHKIAPMIITD